MPHCNLKNFLIFVSLFLPSANPLSFNFSGFNQTSVSSSILLQDDAFFNQNIMLSKNSLASNITNSKGRAVYNQPLLLWNSKTGELTDFITHFSFRINSLDKEFYGDGLTFFLSSYPSIIPKFSAGGYLGLFSNNTAFNKSKNNLVAVEFDTYRNSWDPSADHVGINVNSIVSVTNVTWNSSIKDGRLANAWVSYNSSTKNLSVFLTYAKDPVFSGNSSLTYHVDLSKILPEKVAMGFSASTGKVAELHELLSWDFSSNLEEETEGAKSKVGLIAGLTVSIVVLMTVFVAVWFVHWRKAKQEDSDGENESIDDEFEKDKGPMRFTFNELASATDNFAGERKLGQGGFGEVYKGLLNNEDVAIKRVSAGSKQGKKEYISEVKIISRVRHRNLVQLVGWCHKQSEFLLVYKFMPNGSLDAHLYNQEKFLPWPERYKIALGLASCLLYLHEEWEQCVVHRDIKPSNVMLDSEFEAKLGDFGLARLVDHEIGSQTTMLAGTMGYLAPESIETGRARKESDVYSFGIVALEIACGRKPVEFGKIKLLEWVWELYGKRMIFEAADERLKMDFDEKEMEQLMVVGLWCAHPDHILRPSIRQAISALKFESPLPNLPPSMPVPRFVAPLMQDILSGSSVAGSSGMSSGVTGYTTNSSNMTQSSGSPSTFLLQSHKSET
ncbi:uncharacterized protein A4U43_C03F10850 [Asparagus officinalis]|uniref:non-specific serine/threonine protein kinase n=1 Tax=Asparagus officinalis TaxID=4686 RepID=A0A5P1F8Z5_ASPOF|nr:L-type lectin-domain containing receptor kinase IX.1-like [Asparagus officinalis]ONK74858.1 uncharacterized protein A4U43_C03F10850 [Asparagus officinalis]